MANTNSINAQVDVASGQQQTTGSGVGPQTAYRFSNDELRVLRQCNKESFYQRSLPLSALFSIGTYYAVKTGYFKSHPRFGPSPKVLVAATVGYFVGKFSYQSKCAEKMMQLPNSQFGEMLRQRKRHGGHQEILPDSGNTTWPVMEPLPSNQTHDFVSDIPQYEGLDDPLRLTSDDVPVLEDDALPPQTHQATSYEELRSKNREEHEQKHSKAPYRPSAGNDVALPARQPQRPSAQSLSAKAKNKYGDVWEE